MANKPLHTYQIKCLTEREMAVMRLAQEHALDQGITYKRLLFDLMESVVDSGALCCECLAETDYVCPDCSENTCLNCLDGRHNCGEDDE